MSASTDRYTIISADGHAGLPVEVQVLGDPVQDRTCRFLRRIIEAGRL